MQISLNSICSWVIFITKPQVYYKADCNIYIILNSWTCLSWFSLPLDWKLNFIVTLKWQNLVFIWVKKIISESYTILKYFLCILSFLTSCKLENLGVQWYATASFVFHFPMHRKHVCNTLNISPDTTGIRASVNVGIYYKGVGGFVVSFSSFAAYARVESISHILLQTSGPGIFF